MVWLSESIVQAKMKNVVTVGLSIVELTFGDAEFFGNGNKSK
jgi:hypothetical protein